MALTAERAQEVVQTYINSFANNDAASIVALFADNATVEDPIGSDILDGIDAIREFYTAAVGMGLTLELLGPVRTAVNELAFPFKVNTPNGFIEVIDTFAFNEEGKIVQMRAYWGESNVTQND